MNHRRERQNEAGVSKLVLCVTAIAALLSLTAATYAWFTSNQEVSTTRASARTAEESLELQISSDGSTFSNASPVSICAG